MTPLLLALQFFTSIPLKAEKEFKKENFSHSLIYFPIVGALIGCLLCLINLGLENLLLFNLAAIIIVAAWVLITGALHLDGLADTFDALGSGKNKERMLEIMRDSRIGAFGAIALILAIMLKFSAVLSLPGLKPNALILAPALGRFSLVWPLFIFPYGRKEGKAKIFFENVSLKPAIISTVISLVLSILAFRVSGIIIFAVISALSLIIAAFFNNKFSGLTGDNLGALVEITEILTLILVTISA